ncbi:MAG: dihydropteroate synthase, partial [Actinomycetia bacterium]|nr:dihydropteroate synthase [Actinomycetes bacterium]
LAREVADGYQAGHPDRPRWVLGSVGPGTKLPTLGQARFATLRDGYAEQVAGLIAGGVDAVLIETCQDPLQAKSAVIGAKRAMAAAGRRLPIIVNVTVEATGTMLLGTELGAALTALEPLGIDVFGMNCATGPAPMGAHLRHLAAISPLPISVLPNAGLPELGPAGAVYPLTPDELASALVDFARDHGAALVGGCCGTTPEHIRAVAAAVAGMVPAESAAGRAPRVGRVEPGASSLYQAVGFRQDAGVLMVGERTNANGSKAFREALLADDYDECVDIAREQVADGAHLLDVCVDYVGRDGAADMRQVAELLAAVSRAPLMLDSTEPDVLAAGLEALGGRSVLNSVTLEDGDAPGGRFDRVAGLAREHGAALVALTIDERGQARTAPEKVRVAERLLDTLRDRYGIRACDVFVDCLTFTLATGQPESRRDGAATIEAIRELKRRRPEAQTTLGVSNISFGLNPAARQVLNSVFLHECVTAGLDSAIVHASKILPMSKITDEQRSAALDLIYDRRRDGHDPLAAFMALFEGVSTRSSAESRSAELAALPLAERLARRIIDGERAGLEADLDEALRARPALEIINDTLLGGMRTVGELFGSGQMQLPFVLRSAEVMKAAVSHLEPQLSRADAVGKGTVVLATVTGDVHDIGKNLVDIILSNNGYTVVNLGIKQPIGAILDAAEAHRADAIGMSGLLVKSTMTMRENLEQMNAAGVAGRWPVLLGGAALTRAYVEDDLSAIFAGDVRYARDAFEGLRLMDALTAARRGGAGGASGDASGSACGDVSGDGPGVAVGGRALAEEDAARERRRERRARSRQIAAARQRKATEERAAAQRDATTEPGGAMAPSEAAAQPGARVPSGAMAPSEAAAQPGAMAPSDPTARDASAVERGARVPSGAAERDASAVEREARVPDEAAGQREATEQRAAVVPSTTAGQRGVTAPSEAAVPRAAAEPGPPWVPEPAPARSDVATDNPVPAPPFWGDRAVTDIALADYAPLLDERALFRSQWGLRGARGGTGPSTAELIETEGRPRLRYWLDRFETEGLLRAAAVYGYFHCVSAGDDLIVLGGDGAERTRFAFPRQRRDHRLCLADFFHAAGGESGGETDVLAMQIVTVGERLSEYTRALFEADHYRDYLEAHGLSVQLTEALAEHWHRRVRGELVLPGGAPIAASDATEAAELLRGGYRGARFSLGYGACPNLEDRAKIVALLRPERIGVTLSEGFQLCPEQSTDALVAHHPQARHFNT